MILTITANPSVDISYQLDQLNIDGVSRTEKVLKTAGGKGLNVGNVLQTLGADVAHSGFIGGALGEFIKETLAEKGQEARFVEIEGATRNCIAILHEGKQTEILEKGPEITQEEKDKFIASLDKITDGCDILNISGSLPKGLDVDFYQTIIKYAKDNNKFISVDTSGKTLESVIKSDIKPDLIKPNETELSDVLGFEVNKDNLNEVLFDEPFKSINTIIVSLGKDGAVVKIKDKLYKASVPVVEAINPVGSGDSSVAGALYAIEKQMSDVDVIKTSMTCGLLNVLNPQTATINMDDFVKYFDQIKVEEI
ncbi:hexose kinase [Anaerococcus urinomassiliensis]|uniref:hexose kinase n=1 Tax=Anaerococcus urinomassiliensis TaxID=1745712 RepID=UPI00093E3E96|nr:hexose kinase [Anaerococcus urinomassiliensis]